MTAPANAQSGMSKSPVSGARGTEIPTETETGGTEIRTEKGTGTETVTGTATGTETVTVTEGGLEIERSWVWKKTDTGKIENGQLQPAVRDGMTVDLAHRRIGMADMEVILARDQVDEVEALLETLCQRSQR